MKIKSGFVLEQVGDSYVAVAVGKLAKEFKGFITVNEVGAEIWKAMAERDTTIEEIESAILNAFDASPEQVHADVVEFVNKLLNSGIAE